MFKLECVGKYIISYEAEKVVKVLVTLNELITKQIILVAFDEQLIKELKKNTGSLAKFYCNDGFINKYKNSKGQWVVETTIVISSIDFNV